MSFRGFEITEIRVIVRMDGRLTEPVHLYIRDIAQQRKTLVAQIALNEQVTEVYKGAVVPFEKTLLCSLMWVESSRRLTTPVSWSLA